MHGRPSFAHLKATAGATLPRSRQLASYAASVARELLISLPAHEPDDSHRIGFEVSDRRKICRGQNLSAAAAVLRVRNSPRFKGAQIRCRIDFAARVARRTMFRNEYKTNHDMVPLPGIYNGLNFVVAHLAAAVLKEDGSTGTEVRVALKTRPDACNHASPSKAPMNQKLTSQRFPSSIHL
jgi:hypothetical protein